VCTGLTKSNNTSGVMLQPSEINECRMNISVDSWKETGQYFCIIPEYYKKY